MKETVIELKPIPVLYVAGEQGRPYGEQAPKAFASLEAPLATLKGRHFYGVVQNGEYRACVAIAPGDETSILARGTLPGGRYRRIRIADWKAHRDQIGAVAADLLARGDFDPHRPLIEFYRSQRELYMLAPVA